ncbi:hypothetical protein L873DRAFT_276275 [Choiromyces venosus 120613-1]|uniref:Uncharacterized protein n=1 Tax=Choiromyces venosus 120613-1 TaxID=1336337 RepID=A0A3N4K166_9PEZI|nr:hypothetical protein L873DRAFT_276275 [Choiromyces venosus 120613-1]
MEVEEELIIKCSGCHWQRKLHFFPQKVNELRYKTCTPCHKLLTRRRLQNTNHLHVKELPNVEIQEVNQAEIISVATNSENMGNSENIENVESTQNAENAEKVENAGCRVCRAY